MPATNVGVAVAPEVDGDHRRRQGQQCDGDAPPDRPHRAELHLGYPHHADERVAPLQQAVGVDRYAVVGGVRAGRVALVVDENRMAPRAIGPKDVVTQLRPVARGEVAVRVHRGGGGRGAEKKSCYRGC